MAGTPQPPAEGGERKAEVDPAALSSDRLGVEEGEDESGVAAVGKADSGGGDDRECVPAVPTNELVRSRVTVGKRRLDERSGVEADLASCEGVLWWKQKSPFDDRGLHVVRAAGSWSLTGGEASLQGRAQEVRAHGSGLSS